MEWVKITWLTRDTTGMKVNCLFLLLPSTVAWVPLPPSRPRSHQLRRLRNTRSPPPRNVVVASAPGRATDATSEAALSPAPSPAKPFRALQSLFGSVAWASLISRRRVIFPCSPWALFAGPLVCVAGLNVGLFKILRYSTRRSSSLHRVMRLRGGGKLSLPLVGGAPSWVGAMFTLFFAAGVCEIGGGYLVWESVRGGKPWWFAALGCAVLSAYGFVPTFQPDEAGQFGRIYAAYGAYFIVLSLAFAWLVEGQKPDKGDILGAAVATAGAAIITFWPRPK